MSTDSILEAIGFSASVEKQTPEVYTLVQEDVSDKNNNTENLSAKSKFNTGFSLSI
jgi:hypothetical protein